ncbi:uncharacterized protein LOC127168719 [Labeo rohita]|uniref:uncharacterized protein LOC127168719 n=1 Tax=Labeo rohita TaxID=84645 RepID=UPI0021E24F52|nr:uncharacterized protein LOC127168719 [Labeo rohita]
MSLTVSQDEGVTVITFTSKPNSEWPIPCQILCALCHSPACAVSQHIKAKMMSIYATLGIVQIIVGILMTGILFVRSGVKDDILMINAPFWLGGVFVVVGVVSIVAARSLSYFLLLVTVVLNTATALLAKIGLALYAWELMSLQITTNMSFQESYQKMIREALDITMMIFTVLQLCVAISFTVLSLKELFRMNSVKDPQLYKPLKEEIIATRSHSQLITYWRLVRTHWLGVWTNQTYINCYI